MKRDTPSSSSSSSSSNSSSSRKKANVAAVDLTNDVATAFVLPRQVSDEFLDKIKHATSDEFEHIFLEKKIPSQLGPVKTEATNLNFDMNNKGKPVKYSFNRCEMTKKLSAEFWSTEMQEDADNYLEDYGHWDYSHKPTENKIYQCDDIDHIVLRAKISGGRGMIQEKKDDSKLGTFPSCENDALLLKIVRVPKGLDFKWFLSETGREEVHKSLNELYNWLNTGRICKQEKNDAQLRKHEITNHPWENQALFDRVHFKSLVSCSPPITVYCGRAAMTGQTLCTKCFCVAKMSDEL